MPMYTFYMCRPNGVSATFEVFELPGDGDTFSTAGMLLSEHLACDHVEIWDGERPVMARHRFQPVLRPIGLRQPAKYGQARPT